MPCWLQWSLHMFKVLPTILFSFDQFWMCFGQWCVSFTEHNSTLTTVFKFFFSKWKKVKSQLKVQLLKNLVFFNTCIITSHFFRYTTFCLICGTDSKRCWKHPSAILVQCNAWQHHSWCRFAGYMSMMWISFSTTFQGCSIGLKSGDLIEAIRLEWPLCHVQWNQSEMIGGLWRGVLSCKKQPSEDGTLQS